METWKDHYLKVRKLANSNNSLIVKKHFIRDKVTGEFNINPNVSEDEIYKGYVRACSMLNTNAITDGKYKITQSDRLRQNMNQRVIKNEYSKVQDKLLKDIVKDIINRLQSENPNYSFGIDPNYSTQLLEKILGQDPITHTTSSIKPDSGLVWVLINSKKYYILVSEQKRQGTNDKRLREGLEAQTRGNATERLGKNYNAIEILFDQEDICPFVAWLQGCDFYDEEGQISDRVRTIFKFQKENEIHLYWKRIGLHNYAAGSYFMKGHSMYDQPGSSDWSEEYMYEILYEVANKSLEHYISKYGK